MGHTAVQRDGVEFILPFLLFVFLMALGSDYNILVMRRIREEAHSQPLREAVREAIALLAHPRVLLARPPPESTDT